MDCACEQLVVDLEALNDIHSEDVLELHDVLMQ